MTELRTVQTIDPFEPSYLEEFIGQRAIVKTVRMEIAAAQRRRQRGEEWAADLRMLSVGPPGVGKTVLSKIIALDLGLALLSTSGTQFDEPADVRTWLQYVHELNEPLLWLVDEFDGMRSRVMEEFHTPLTHNAFPSNQGLVSLPPIVFYLTTNYLAAIPEPIYSRCRVQFEFTHYSLDELATIVYLSARRSDVTITEEACRLLAEYGQGEPRRANNLLRSSIVEAEVAGITRRVDGQIVEEVIRRLGLFPQGLTGVQVKIMRYLAQQRLFRAGLQSIASAVGVPAKDIQLRLEKHPLRLGFVVVKAGGRELTVEGLRYLQSITVVESV